VFGKVRSGRCSFQVVFLEGRALKTSCDRRGSHSRPQRETLCKRISCTHSEKCSCGRAGAGGKKKREKNSQIAGVREETWMIIRPLRATPEPCRRTASVVLGGQTGKILLGAKIVAVNERWIRRKRVQALRRRERGTKKIKLRVNAGSQGSLKKVKRPSP